MRTELTPYRQTDDRHLIDENRRLAARVEELEAAFEGILPYQKNRKVCPFCETDTMAGAGYVESQPIAAKRRWFRKSVPAHVRRQHVGTGACKAVWRERMPPDLESGQRPELGE